MRASLAAFRPGEVLVAESTSPDWEPVMKTAAAIVTSHGGRTCHAAIVARELGVPAVVGAEGAIERLATGAVVTVSCAEGEAGKVYDGAAAVRGRRGCRRARCRGRAPRSWSISAIPNSPITPRCCPMTGSGSRAWSSSSASISASIRWRSFRRTRSPRRRRAPRSRRLVRNYAQPADFFVEKLSEGVGTIAAAFYPKPVIVRLSDFKTNEYASLIGGAAFEPKEDNPMLGFRGASRYAHPAYAAGFALECAALARVRDEMGLTNLKSWCRSAAASPRPNR